MTDLTSKTRLSDSLLKIYAERGSQDTQRMAQEVLDLRVENQALRNLANNLQPGPISVALGGAAQEAPYRHAAEMQLGASNLRALAHQGDPCIYCGIGHDNVPPGICLGRLKQWAQTSVNPDNTAVLSAVISEIERLRGSVETEPPESYQDLYDELSCVRGELEEARAEIAEMRSVETQQNASNGVGKPPCDHDSMTPCPPECREAKEEWRRDAAREIAAAQRAPSNERFGLIRASVARGKGNHDSCPWSCAADLQWCVSEIERLRIELANALDHNSALVELAKTATADAVAEVTRLINADETADQRRLQYTRQLLDRAIEVMTEFHAEFEPDDSPELRPTTSVHAFKDFVDRHARLMFERAQLDKGLPAESSVRCTCFEDGHSDDCDIAQGGCCGQCKGSQEETPCHPDPTGKTREPPHCPSCSCGLTVKTADPLKQLCSCGKPMGEHPVQPPWWPCMLKSPEKTTDELMQWCLETAKHEPDCDITAGVEKVARHLTDDDRSRLSRASDTSVTVVDPGFEEASGNDAEDAAKWRALRNCARITAIGCAGLTQPANVHDPYAHLTLNFWTGADFDGDPGPVYAREWLDKFVAKALRSSLPIETPVPTGFVSADDVVRAEEASVTHDAIAPNKYCNACQRFIWLDQFEVHKCVPVNGSERTTDR